ncbi:hypothetical protein BpHYR1_046834 [Brachionus plicatilis]|uniref:MULE transposase domain-containing protein n=1 Tax=Brachionus plicatilis TaxID=10195 RepID=A0A3M7S0I3_BRAPC|nr:hypothetical protein BpHYR1_046834 [Brachionus plicatilis]
MCHMSFSSSMLRTSSYGKAFIIMINDHIIMIGTTDRRKHFHPYGICITSNETGHAFRFVFEALKKVVFDVMQLEFSPKIVIADGADAITIGFQDTFVDIFELRLMCFAHVIRKVDMQLNRFATDAQKAIKKSIRQDIMLLQLCESEAIFDAALQLFITKLRAQKSEIIDNFIDFSVANGLRD